MSTIDQSYAGRTALITGASVGIGREIAEHLLARGCHVICVARRPYDGVTDNVTSMCVDLADRDAVRALATQIAAEHKVDILVNNAGVVRNTPVENISDEEFDFLNDLHLWTAIQLTQAVIPHMKSQGFGRILNMSSRAVVGMSQRTVYAATKAFWENLEEVHATAFFLKEVTKDSAFTSVNVPLHPGALRYYEEAGFTVPDALRP